MYNKMFLTYLYIRYIYFAEVIQYLTGGHFSLPFQLLIIDMTVIKEWKDVDAAVKLNTKIKRDGVYFNKNHRRMARQSMREQSSQRTVLVSPTPYQ